MENKDKKVIEISAHDAFVMREEKELVTNELSIKKVTNPITKSFIKFVQRTKDKFSLKDIIR